jgi:hypothetical protein
MSSLSLPMPTALPDLSLRRLMADDRILTTTGLMLFLLMLPMIAAAGLDARVLDGEGIWLKPLKFAFSMGVFLLTLAAFARHLPERLRSNGRFRAYGALVALAAVTEMLIIGGAAAVGVRSHFNYGTPFWAAMYSIMGVMAVVLTSAALVYGIAVWRNRAAEISEAMRTAIGLGLVLTFALTLPTAGTMASVGALIGDPVTGAHLPVLAWSLEVGDLRISHFAATHALQIIPLIVWVVGWQRVPVAEPYSTSSKTADRCWSNSPAWPPMTDPSQRGPRSWAR